MRDDINLGKEVRKEPGQRMGAGRVVGKECRRWGVNICSPNDHSKRLLELSVTNNRWQFEVGKGCRRQL